VIDVSLLRRRVATRGRGCRPQRVDIQQNKLTRGCNALASTASPNAPISLPLARGHLLLDGQCLKQAHGWGGGLCLPKKTGYYFFIIHFIYHFLFYANPLPSFIPCSLNLHNRVAGEEEVLLKGVVVDVEAEEMEEEAVDSSVGIVGREVAIQQTAGAREMVAQ